MANRTVSVALKMLIGDYVGPADKAAKATDNIGESASKSAARYKQGADAIVQGAGVAAIAGAGALFAITKASMGFEKAMSGVSAATNASAADINLLREAAMKAGADTKFSATEAAEAETALAKAGIATADILGGALSGALSLAAAGQMGVAEAAELAASAMTQFGLSGKDVPHIADLLAAGAGKAQGSVQDMGQALNQVGLIANQAGWSIEETTGVLAEFASAGLLGSDAGTSLKTMLLRLEAPTAEAADLMEALGINAYDAGGALKSPVEMAGALQRGLGKLSNEQRNSAMATIFGSDAIRAAAILYKDGSAGADKWGKAVNNSGFAADQAAKLMDNLAGDVETLGGSIETALIGSGSAGNDVLRGLTKGATGAVNAFANLPGPVQGGAVAMLALGTAGAGAVAVLGTMVPRIQAGRKSLAEMGRAGEIANRAVGKLGKGLAIGSGALAGIATAGVLLKQLQDAAFGAAPGVEQVKSALLDTADAGRLSAALPKLADGYGDLGAQIQRLADPSLGDKARKTLTSVFTLGQADPALLRAAKENLSAIDQALKDLVTSGHADQAARAFKSISDEAVAQGASVEQVKEVLPQYKDALAGVANESKLAADGISKSGDAAGAAAKPMSTLEKEARALGVEFKDGASAADLMKSAIDRLNGASLDALDTDIAFRESLASVTEAFKENGKTVDINTAKGRANLSTISSAIKAAASHAEAVAEQTGSLQAGNKVFASHIEQLRRTATAAGLPKAAVDALIRTYGRVPRKVSTDVMTRGAAQAKSSANAVEEALRRIPASRNARVGVTGANAAINEVRRVQRVISTLTGKAVAIQVGSIGSGIRARAGGGPVEAHRPYLVGEEGRELFVPSVAGRIIDAGRTSAMLPGSVSSGSGGGGSRSSAGMPAAGGGGVVLEIRSGGSRFDDVLVDVLQRAVKVRGGNVQTVLGAAR